MIAPVASPDSELAEFVAEFYDDPYGFVLGAFPWGEPGTLEKYAGPDEWQTALLKDIGNKVKERAFNGRDPVAPIREAIASGHGIGKTTLVAWLACWILSTRVNSKGTVTANTFPQLETKTWASILTWIKRCITSKWFVAGRNKIAHKDFPETWFLSAQTCREENSEAFAGQHAADSTSYYIFDESSAIPDKIWEVAEGGLSDGEPHIYAFGNPTRSTGKFYRICFGSEQHRWSHRSIDSRTSGFANQVQIAEWIADYGEDSDFVRVRVRGLPPRAGELQWIDQERVWESQHRTVQTFPDDPLIAGVDVSDGGSAWNVVRFRRGFDAKSVAPIRIPGEATRGDRSAFLGRLAEVLRDQRPSHKVAMMFVDSAFGAPYVERLQAMGFKNVQEVRFGAQAIDKHFANQRAYMWSRMKEWLLNGSIDPKDQKLELDLTSPGYHINKSDQLVIESKESMAKRGVASPDDADALCLTWAAPVGRPDPPPPPPSAPRSEYSWMG